MTEMTGLSVQVWRLFYTWAGGQPMFLQIVVAWGLIELVRGLLHAPLYALRAFRSRRQYSTSLKKALGRSQRGSEKAPRASTDGWIG
jgi:hypothetical protein